MKGVRPKVCKVWLKEAKKGASIQEGKLKLSKIGPVKIILHREIPGITKTVAIGIPQAGTHPRGDGRRRSERQRYGQKPKPSLNAARNILARALALEVA